MVRTRPYARSVRAWLSPRLLPLHVAGVLVVLAAAWLGWWQIGVWESQRSTQADTLADATPVALDRVLGPDSPFPAKQAGRQVELTGEWLTADTVYVEQPHGYWVVTPVLTPTGSAIPVVRGLSATVTAGPATGSVQIGGWLQASAPADADVVTSPGHAAGSDVLATLAVSALVDRVDADLYSGYVIARTVDGEAVSVSASGAGLTAASPAQLPKPTFFTGLRNFSYGLEWWVFGGFAVFLWFRWTRDLVGEARVPGTDPGLSHSAPL